MFSTCLFCSGSLGANQTVEVFPVGRRLAFDTRHGRLWVVCRKCERWNLSPLEERWEAIEACERLYRGTRPRVATEHIGLARVPEGLELVRIGAPLRPEFAAWRYGDQFGRRRRRAILLGTAAAVAGASVLIGSVAAGASALVLGQSGNFVNLWVNGRTRVRVRMQDGRVLRLRHPDLLAARFLPAAGGGYDVKVGWKRVETFRGDEAGRVAGLILPGVNRTGGRPATVRAAVARIEEDGGPERFLARTIAQAGRMAPGSGLRRGRDAPGAIARLPHATRLALEMSLHEEQERRALEGELIALEAAWREAEEIAGIADDLLVPARDLAFIERHRGAADDDASGPTDPAAAP